MSQKNVDAVGRFVGAFNARDVHAMVELATAECVIVAQRSSLEGAFTDVRHWAESAYEWAPDTQMFVERILPVGDDRVVVLGRQTGTASVGGASFDVPLAVVADLEAGLLKRAEAHYATHAEALEAAGLSEQTMFQENVKIAQRSIEAFFRSPRRGGTEWAPELETK